MREDNSLAQEVPVTPGQTAEPEMAAAGAPRKRYRWITGPLRWLVVLFMVDTLLQAVLAGMFVTGDVDLVFWHDVNSNVNSSILFFVWLWALLLWRPARGPIWPMWLSVVLFLLVETQKTLGYLRLVDWHIPMGVAYFGITAMLAGWAWNLRLERYPITPRKQGRKKKGERE